MNLTQNRKAKLTSEVNRGMELDGRQGEERNGDTGTGKERHCCGLGGRRGVRATIDGDISWAS